MSMPTTPGTSHRTAARSSLGNKADTLARLAPLVRASRVPRFISISARAWPSSTVDILARLGDRFAGVSVIVRSSAACEDARQGSCAGRFRSCAAIDGGDRKALRAALDSVIDSYGDLPGEHGVIVQELAPAGAAHGVITTRAAGDLAPYYVINLAPPGQSIDSVTAGAGDQTRTWYLHRDATPPAHWSGALRLCIDAAREIESLLESTALDIEIAVHQEADGAFTAHLLQARPLVPRATFTAGRPSIQTPCSSSEPGTRSTALLGEAATELRARFDPDPLLAGTGTIFSNMSDWNPAEIVGRRPRRLALSLYEHLITEEVWARQRAEFGYRDVRPRRLIVQFAGQPYIDVRVMLNSFVPAALGGPAAQRLVDLHLARLRREPELHDKVEFEVVHSATPLDGGAAIGRLVDEGLSRVEVEALARELLPITAGAIARVGDDLRAAARLGSPRQATQPGAEPPLAHALDLLDEARALGTLPFCHLARSAFIAVRMLRSLVDAGALERPRLEAFLASVRTVCGEFRADCARHAAGSLDHAGFLARYGHLRPGTYEITSPTYADADWLRRAPCTGPDSLAASEQAGRGFQWTVREARAIVRLLARARLGVSLREFTEFLRRSIAGRERAKFIFTRHLSAALESIARFGAERGLSREELSHVPLAALRGALDEPTREATRRLRALAADGAARHALGHSVLLPDVICSEAELSAFEQLRSTPNYIGAATVRGPLLPLAAEAIPAGAQERARLTGALVLMTSADPGCDWIFERGIAGLITRFGGCNSHLAIRAAELGVPAAIGVGEALFERLERAAFVELDCGGRRLTVLR